MKLNFRKIASVLSSAVMVSSTVALAAAATYPAPFISSGTPDVAVVFGSAPGAQLDLAAVVDVTNDLQYRLGGGSGSGSSGGSSTTVSGGDYVKLAKPADNLNIRDVVSTVFGTVLTDNDLPMLLKDGVYSNDENTDYDYEQRITLGTGLILNYFQDSDYNDRAPAVGINLTSSQTILNYSLDFTSDPESDVASGDLVDLETTTINILGKEYYVSDADNITNAGAGTITLLDTANSALATEGETTTVTVGSKSYDVSITYISTTEVKLNVNGEDTNTLAEGAVYKLTDGTYVGIKDIFARDVQGVLGKVEFSLGSGKLELRNGQTIEINDDSINEVYAEIRAGTSNGARSTIDRINLVWKTDDDQFVTPATELVLPGFENIKFSMGNLATRATETVKVTDGSSYYTQLEANIKDGAVTVPLLYANASGEFIGLGKGSSDRLLSTNATSAVVYNHTAGHRMFVGSWNSSNSAESYLLRFTSFVNDSGTEKATVEKNSGGSWTKVCEDRRSADTCTLGSLTLTLTTVVAAGNEKTVTFAGNAGAEFNTLYTNEGLKVSLPWIFPAADTATSTAVEGGMSVSTLNSFYSNTTDAGQTGPSPLGSNLTALSPSGVTGFGFDTFHLNFTEEDRNDNKATGGRFGLTLNDNSDGEVEVSAIATGRPSFTDPDDSNHVLNRVYSDASTLVELNGQSSDQRTVTITYSGGETYADLFLATGSATVSSSGNGTTTTTTSSGVRQLGSVAVSDAEVGSVSNKNLIVVGGSCVNQVAAQLLGVGFPTCGSAWETRTGVGAGNFLVQTFSRSGGKVATLVAGYNAGDTANAVTKLTTEPSQFDITAGKAFRGNLQQVSMVEVTPAA